MKFRTGAALALLLSSSLLMNGCSALSDDDSDEITIAAGFYPLAWVAERVAGDHAEVINLTRAGQEAHDAGLSIEKTANLAAADLVVLSSGFQPEVDAAAKQNAEGEILDATEFVELMQAASHGQGGHDHDGEGEGEDSATQDSATKDRDPHFWLDPMRMAELADAVAVELGKIDPDQAASYQDAARTLRAELTALDQQYTDGLAACDRTTVVVSHDAFGYLRRYGLSFEPIAGLSPDAEPTPADLQHLQQLIREEKITTVFSETLGTSTLAQSLADDLGVVRATLDPIEGLADSGSGADYLSIMGDNLEALQQAGGC